MYLRAAEVNCQDTFGIYEIIGNNNRIFYKIFHTKEDFQSYLLKNKDKECKDKNPIYISRQYIESTNAQIRKLNNEEVKNYISEHNQFAK